MTGRAPRRGRAVLAVLTAAVLTGAVALPVWVRASGVGVLSGTLDVGVRGAVAAPAVPAAALVLGAAGVALALAGRVGRWLVVAAVAGSALSLALSAIGVLVDPAPVARAAAAEATGVDRVVGAAAVTVWPWLTLVLALVVLAGAAVLARDVRGLAGPSRRHEAGEAAASVPGTADAHADWDALTRGDDPT